MEIICLKCGQLLADIVLEYLDDIKNISSLDIKEDDKNIKKAELFKKYYINNYCCKITMMTYYDSLHYIK